MGWIPESFFFMSTTDTPESSDSGLFVPQESSRQESPPPAAPPPAEEPQSHVLSSLRLENQLLRSEVSSLNQEMASVIQRAKDLQEGTYWEVEQFTPYLLLILLFDDQLFNFSHRVEPDTFTCRQMEFWAVTNWQDATEPAVAGWRPDGRSVCQRWPACSPEGQTRWSWSAAEVP